MTLRRLPPLKTRTWDPANTGWVQNLGWLWQPISFGDIRILHVSSVGSCSVLTHTLRTTKLTLPSWLAEHVAALYTNAALIVDVRRQGTVVRAIHIHDAIMVQGRPLGDLTFPERLEQLEDQLRVESIGVRRARTYAAMPPFGPSNCQVWGRSAVVRGWHADAALILKL